jgi:hypothetical protein
MPLPPSAADWTRLQRLKSSANYGTQIDLMNNTDMTNLQTPPACNGCSSRAGKRRDHDSIVGMSKIRREASKWTDYIAASHVDFVTVSETVPTTNTRKLFRRVLCPSCSSSSLPTKVGPLLSFRNQHLRMV